MLFPLKDASQDITTDSGHLPTLNVVLPTTHLWGKFSLLTLHLMKGQSDAEPWSRAYG